MLIIKRYKKHKSGKRIYWEYKILYRDFFTKKMKTRTRRGFHTKQECLNAAEEMIGYLTPINRD